MNDVQEPAEAVAFEPRCFEQILDVIDEPVIVLDRAGRVLSWNLAADRMYGHSSEQAFQTRITELLPTDPPGFWEHALRRARVSGRANGEVTICNAWAEDVPVQVRCVLAGSRIITTHSGKKELRALETQLRRAEARLALGNMATDVDHQLRSNLLAIMMATEGLQESCHSGEDRECLGIIRGNAEFAVDMLSRLLDFVRGTESPAAWLDVNLLLGNVARILNTTFPPSIQLELDVDPRVGKIRGEESQLQQMLMNLCLNARDAMREGGSITLSARMESPPQRAGLTVPLAGHTLIEVRDTGCGIPPGDLPQIFKSSFSTKARGCGTGLGLASVERIAKAHGAIIQVKSELGQGTTFGIYFPIKLSESMD